MKPAARGAILVLAATLSACIALSRPVAVDPEATFAAHQEHARIVIDRLARGRSGELRPPSWLRTPGAPTWVLVADGQQLAAFWPEGERVVVRNAPSREAPPVGEVVASWDDQAIRLGLQPAGGPAFRSDVFAREGSGGGPDSLTRAAQTILDVRGTYRATLRDPGGAAVGWLRVKIGPYQEAPRIFDGVLPAAIQPELAAATVIRLGSEIDWIESHTLDVYRGTSSGPLDRSIPAPR
jgi:hypothetical protein